MRVIVATLAVISLLVDGKSTSLEQLGRKRLNDVMTIADGMIEAADNVNAKVELKAFAESVKALYESLENSIKTVETELGSKLSTAEDKCIGRLDAVEPKVDSLETANSELRSQLETAENTCKGRLNGLDEEVKSLKNADAELQSDLTTAEDKCKNRLDALEPRVDSAETANSELSTQLETAESTCKDRINGLEGTLESEVKAVKDHVNEELEEQAKKIDEQLGQVDVPGLENEVADVRDIAKTARDHIKELKKVAVHLGDRGVCATGLVGCTDCEAKEGRGSKIYRWQYTQGVKFEHPFAEPPHVVLAVNEIYQRASGRIDWYGWKAQAIDVTAEGFTADIELIDRKMNIFKAAWIACPPQQPSKIPNKWFDYEH